MQLTDFANKRFAVYGLGIFKGDNIKTITGIHFGVAQGVNERTGKRWGYFEVSIIDGEVVFSYDLKESGFLLCDLKDKHFKKANIAKIPDKIQLQMVLNHLYSVSSKYKHGMIESVEQSLSLMNIIEGVAYLGRLRLGRFWMVEIVGN